MCVYSLEPAGGGGGGGGVSWPGKDGRVAPRFALSVSSQD